MTYSLRRQHIAVRSATKRSFGISIFSPSNFLELRLSHTSSTKEKAWCVLQLTETTSEVHMYPFEILTLPQSHLYNALHIFACMKACHRKGNLVLTISNIQHVSQGERTTKLGSYLERRCWMKLILCSHALEFFWWRILQYLCWWCCISVAIPIFQGAQ